MGNSNPGSAQSTTSKDEVGEETQTPTSPKKGWRKLLERAGNWMQHKDKDEWLKDMRGNLSLVATVISTMTFQMAFNPPGGVRPAKDTGDDIGCENYKKQWQLCPGEAVLAVVYPDLYFRFLLWNTICFVASLSVCLLLVSGIRLHHRFPMWLLSIGMCVTLTSLALTYITAVSMLTPEPVWGYTTVIHQKLIYAWIGLLGLLGLFLTLRLAIWGVNFFIQKSKTSTTPENNKKEISVTRF